MGAQTLSRVGLGDDGWRTAYGTCRNLKRGRHVGANPLVLKSLPSRFRQKFQLENQIFNWSSLNSRLHALRALFNGPPSFDFQKKATRGGSGSELKCENRLLRLFDGKHLETPRGGSTFDVHAVAFAHGLGTDRRSRWRLPPCRRHRFRIRCCAGHGRSLGQNRRVGRLSPGLS